MPLIIPLSLPKVLSVLVTLFVRVIDDSYTMVLRFDWQFVLIVMDVLMKEGKLFENIQL